MSPLTLSELDIPKFITQTGAKLCLQPDKYLISGGEQVAGIIFTEVTSYLNVDVDTQVFI